MIDKNLAIGKPTRLGGEGMAEGLEGTWLMPSSTKYSQHVHPQIAQSLLHSQTRLSLPFQFSRGAPWSRRNGFTSLGLSWLISEVGTAVGHALQGAVWPNEDVHVELLT